MRHAADTRYYEDYVELCNRYKEMGLTEMLKHAERKKAQCLKERRFRPKHS